MKSICVKRDYSVPVMKTKSYFLLVTFCIQNLDRIKSERSLNEIKNVDFGQAKSIAKNSNEHTKQVRSDEKRRKENKRTVLPKPQHICRITCQEVSIAERNQCKVL